MIPSEVSGKNVKYSKTISVPMHNFGDSNSWADPADSKFMLQPPDDEIWQVNSVRTRYSVNAYFHCPMIVEYFAYGGASSIKIGETIYANNNAFIGRYDKIDILALKYNGYLNNMFDMYYNFDKSAPVLYGMDVQPIAGIFQLSMRIEDNQPMKDSNGDSLELVEVRYPNIDVYKIT